MKTNLDRVWACGDITTFDGKLKLIATGFAESAIAVSQAVHTIRPDMKIQPAYSTNTGVPGRRSRARSEPTSTCAGPTRSSRGLIDDFGGPLPDEPDAAAGPPTSTARSCAGSPASSSPCSPRGRSGASCSPTSTAARRRRRRSSTDDPDELRAAAGFSRAKVVYLRSLAEHVLAGELELDRLAELPDDEVIRDAHRGQGHRRVDRAHVPHVHPAPARRAAAGDLGVRNAIQRAYGLETAPKPAEMKAIAEPWRPYRTRASPLPLAQPANSQFELLI